MKKILKLLAILIGSIVAVIVAAAIALPLLFDPNDFKQEITQLVQQETGRELLIKDDIKLSVFPWLGAELGAVELSNAKGFGKAPFATVKHAAVRVKLLPLLRKEVEMDTVVLDGLTLNLIKGKSGRNNWDDLMAPGAAPAKKPKQEGAGLAALAIGGLDIRDSQLSWTDHSTSTAYNLSDLSMRTGALTTGLPVDLNIGFNLGSKQPDIQGRVKLSGSITLDVATQNYAFKNIKLTSDLKGKGVPGGHLDSTVSADISADLASQIMQLTGLTLELPGLKLTGDITGKQILNKPDFSGAIRVYSISPRAVLESINGKAPNTADPKALSKASLQTKLSASANSIRFTDLKATLDDTTLNGDVSVQNFAHPATTFDLRLDAIDLDRYLPPAATGTRKATASPASAAAAAGGQLPLDTLRTLNARGAFRIGKMKASNVRSQDILITLNASNGLISLYPLSAKMYGGTYTGNTRIDARGKSAQYSIDEKITGVQSSPLLKDFTGNDRIEGLGNFSIKMRASGNTPDQIRRSMNGHTSFQFLNGAYKGINVAKLIREAYAKYKGLPPPPDSGPNQTDFSEFSGSGNIVNGILHNNDLSVKSPLLRIGGKGIVNLVTETLDYQVSTSLVKDLEGQGGKPITDLRGVTIPVRLKGPLADPAVTLDLGSVLKKKLEKKLKKQLLKKLGVQETAPPAAATTAQPAPQQAAPPAPPPETDEQRIKREKKELKKKLLERLFK